MGAIRIGIDTGGTFTDVVRWSPRGLAVHKLPSTPDDPARAVLDGLAAVRRSPSEEVDVIHGTTVGLNALLMGRSARTVFVTNRGFEDLIEIGRQDRDDIYALAPHRAVPPVARRLRVGVDCRREPDGRASTPLTTAELERCVARVARLRPAAIAVGLLHSPTDPRDEHRIKRALRRALPGVTVTCSAELLPAFGEYERFCAAILNAAITPVVSSYTARLTNGVGAGRLRLLRSSLGIMPTTEATAFPTRAMFSGPAGGVLATAQLAREVGYDRAAAFDMGGTSADVCLVSGDEPMAADGDAATIAGLPLPVPSVPVHTVGCGGGSIAYADAGGALRVGPQSAGADPGPACYGKGELPTVTDAHVALGHLGAGTLLGGAFPIDVDAAVAAIERLGRELGLTTARTAEGILEVADIAMARAILVITAERAVDPAHVPLVPYGGAGALHAAGLVQRLGLPGALVPPNPGALSAVGLALAGESIEHARAVRLGSSPTDQRTLRHLADELSNAVRAELDRGIDGGKRARVRVVVTVRYRGQGGGIALPLRGDLTRRFAREHERRFGFAVDAPLEIVRVTARGELPARRIARAGSNEKTTRAARSVHGGTERRPPIGGPALRILARDELPIGARVHGPAIIEEPTATTRIPLGFLASVTESGCWLALTSASKC